MSPCLYFYLVILYVHLVPLDSKAAAEEWGGSLEGFVRPVGSKGGGSLNEFIQRNRWHGWARYFQHLTKLVCGQKYNGMETGQWLGYGMKIEVS